MHIHIKCRVMRIIYLWRIVRVFLQIIRIFLIHLHAQPHVVTWPCIGAVWVHSVQRVLSCSGHHKEWDNHLLKINLHLTEKQWSSTLNPQGALWSFHHNAYTSVQGLNNWTKNIFVKNIYRNTINIVYSFLYSSYVYFCRFINYMCLYYGV